MRSFLNSRWRTAVLVAACLALVVTFTVRPRAASSSIVISQVYGGGGNSGATLTNDFVELFNRGSIPIDVTGWTVQYASATGSSWQTTVLSGTIQPGHYYLVQEAKGSGGTTPLPAPDATGAIAMGATAGKVALVSNSTALSGACPSGSSVDFVGFGGANCSEASPTPTLSNTTAAVRKLGGCTETDANSSDFAVGAPTPRNTASPTTSCVLSTTPSGSPAANPSTLEAGAVTLLTVAVAPGSNPTSTGLAVSADLTAIGGSATQPLSDNGTNGDAVAGDNTFSYQATVATATSAGSKALPVTITDAQSRTGTATLQLTVTAPPLALAIHDIQGAGGASPYVGQRVSTSGIVYARKPGSGLFIQAPADEADADPSTSEGVFVYTGATVPAVTLGDEVTVVGTVQEYNGLTEIATPTVTVVSSGNALPVPVLLTPENPDPNGPPDQMERYEGMRVQVDSLTVVGPTGVTGSGASTKSNGQFYGVVAGAARPFREAGLEPGAPALPFMPEHVPHFDGNPELLSVDSDSLGGGALDVTSGAVVSGLVGPLDYSSGSYTIDPETTPTVVGNISAIAVPEAGSGEFTVASWNMLSFKSTDATRMDKALLVIRDVLRLPDILGVEEVDNVATLNGLAAKVNADPASMSPNYRAFLLSTTGSQNVGFLVKSTVTEVNVTEVGRDATFTDPRNGKPALLNDRPPLVLAGEVIDPRGGPSFPLTVIVNHLRSLIDVETAGGTGDFVRYKRRAGAEFLATLIAQHQANGEHVVSIGDYNAFQLNDGYVDVIATILGAPTPADQVLLPSLDLVNPNFADLMAGSPAQQYSYVENGNAQILDHIIVSPDMTGRSAGLVYARTNTDFPKIYSLDATRPERTSDHDPVVAYFKFPTADLKVTTTQAPLGAVLSGSNVTYTLTVTNDADDDATGVTVTDTLPGGMTVVSAQSTEGWECSSLQGTESTTVTCGPGVVQAHKYATITIVASLNCLLPDTVLGSSVKLDAYTYDPNPSNNTNAVSTTVSNPAPTIGGEAASSTILWPVNHKLVPVTIDYDVNDNCGAAPKCELTVSSSERTDGKGDGHTATDWKVVDEHNVLLRAERAGTANGRTYTIGIACTDSVGNVGTKSVVVTVPKSPGTDK